MERKQARQQFEEADRLFRQGQYEQALTILSQLNQAYANQKHILYPAALCLEKLGRIEEAKVLCRQLIGLCDYPKAQDLLNRLDTAPRIALKNDDKEILARQWPEEEEEAEPVVLQDWNDDPDRMKKLIGVIVAGIAACMAPMILIPSEISSMAMLIYVMVVLGSSLLTLYLLFCYVCKRICENAGHAPGILIWIPIVSFIPMLRAAGMSLLWIWVALSPFMAITVLVLPGIPASAGMLLLTASNIACFIMAVAFCINICRACGKSAWLAILMFLPVANAIVMLYLAFSESDNAVQAGSAAAGPRHQPQGEGLDYPGEPAPHGASKNLYIVVGVVFAALVLLALPFALRFIRQAAPTTVAVDEVNASGTTVTMSAEDGQFNIAWTNTPSTLPESSSFMGTDPTSASMSMESAPTPPSMPMPTAVFQAASPGELLGRLGIVPDGAIQSRTWDGNMVIYNIMEVLPLSLTDWVAQYRIRYLYMLTRTVAHDGQGGVTHSATVGSGDMMWLDLRQSNGVWIWDRAMYMGEQNAYMGLQPPPNLIPEDQAEIYHLLTQNALMRAGILR